MTQNGLKLAPVVQNMVFLILPVIAIILEISRPLFPGVDRLLFLGSSLTLSLGGVVTYAKIRRDDTVLPSRYLIHMPLAGVLCSVADFILPQNFVLGMVIFLAAHIFFISSLWPLSENKRSRYSLTVGLLMALYGFPLYVMLIFDPGDFVTLAVIPYILVLLTMCWTALQRYKSMYPTYFRRALGAGAILFVLSDSILAVDKFHNNIPNSQFLVGHSYILALTLILYSVLLARQSLSTE